ncbi:MAG: hypothetical protein P1U89_09620 [Verrucomicrobiales bacterium]|nr:hypothetical protein [Verrucomicrobiales bacterium]
MAILRSTDGKFYEIPDEQLEDKLIPGEEVKAKLESCQPAREVADGEITANYGRWRNCFRNYWRRNCWRNCY